MPVPDHPMRALKGSAEAKRLMEQVRSHRGGKPDAKDRPPAAKKPSYREIADKHLGT